MDEPRASTPERLEEQFSSGRYLECVANDDGTLFVRTEWGYYVVENPDQA
jgi:hypothetical protein